MTSKSCSHRNRVIQRRYKRRGRRSPNNLREPPDPGGRKKKPARTYNFNTFPHHGAPPTSYLQYIKSILVPKFINRREHYLSLRNSLSIDRHTHYKPMGYRCSLIPLPITPNDSTPNANLNDSFLWDNLLHTNTPILPITTLPTDPTHFHSTTPLLHPLPVHSPKNLPLDPSFTLTLVALLLQIFFLKFSPSRNWPRHHCHPTYSYVQPSKKKNSFNRHPPPLPTHVTTLSAPLTQLYHIWVMKVTLTTTTSGSHQHKNHQFTTTSTFLQTQRKSTTQRPPHYINLHQCHSSPKIYRHHLCHHIANLTQRFLLTTPSPIRRQINLHILPRPSHNIILPQYQLT